jgi:hypothetical protein
MANSADDTNDSQFFITDVDLSLAQLPQHLNFENAIFGQLTSGFDIFKKLISTPTDPKTDRPLTPVIIQSVQVITDSHDEVLRVLTPRGVTGDATITVTATGGSGATAVQALHVQVVPDTTDGQPGSTAIIDRPFLGPVATQTAFEDSSMSFQLTARDIDNNPLTFVVRDPTTFSTPANVTVNIQGSLVTLTPAPGFTGTISLLAGVRDQTARGGLPVDDRSNFDTQAFTLNVVPAPTGHITLDPASDTGLFNNDNYTSANSPSGTLTADPGKQIEVLVNGSVATQATETQTPGTYSFTIPPGFLSVGANAITDREVGTTDPLGSLVITYAPSYQSLYVVPGALGTSEQLVFSYESRQAAYHNEIGIYQVDDFTGKVNGIAPGQPGYAQAVLSSPSRQTIFASNQLAGVSRTITVSPRATLRFLPRPEQHSGRLRSLERRRRPLGKFSRFLQLPGRQPGSHHSYGLPGRPCHWLSSLRLGR